MTIGELVLLLLEDLPPDESGAALDVNECIDSDGADWNVW